jgi:hypothetical protein
MIPFLLDGRTLIVSALVVVSLLLMIFAPQAMANLLGEPFSLIGRLVGTIADWLQKGADKLFALVKSVFLIGHPVEKHSIAADVAPTSASQTSAPASSYQAKILEHPASETTVGSSDTTSMSPYSSMSDQPAPYEPETASSITPYPNRNDSSSYSGSYSGAPSQQGDRVYGDSPYGGYGAHGTTATNGNGSSSRAIQPAASNDVNSGALGAPTKPSEPAKPEEPEIHATWVGEVIISHVLYLVAAASCHRRRGSSRRWTTRSAGCFLRSPSAPSCSTWPSSGYCSSQARR